MVREFFSCIAIRRPTENIDMLPAVCIVGRLEDGQGNDEVRVLARRTTASKLSKSNVHGFLKHKKTLRDVHTPVLNQVAGQNNQLDLELNREDILYHRR